MRFVCDHDVDAAVAARVRRLGHDAWTAANAGLSAVSDDEVAVYVDDQSAALLTHDAEFSKRRQRNVVGKHVWLRCSEVDAADLIEVPVGYVVLRPAPAASTADIMRFVAGEVAHYKQIRRLEVVDAIPKSASGKGPAPGTP